LYSGRGTASARPDALTSWRLLRNKNTGLLRLDTIIVPKGQQKQGTGTKAMEAITAFADQHGLGMSLSTA
jgi:hypothetical protein